jgi:hypothetical protein
MHLGSGLHEEGNKFPCPTRKLISMYIFITGGEVCGRYVNDACLICTFVNTPTSMVGSLSKLPRIVIIQINGRLFSTGSRVKPCSFGTTQTIPSCLVMYPPHAVTLLSLTNLGPVKRLDCGEGQMQHMLAPETAFHFQEGCTMTCMR